MPKLSLEVPLADGKLLIHKEEDDQFFFTLLMKCPYGPAWPIHDYFSLLPPYQDSHNIEGFNDLETLLAYVHGSYCEEVLELLKIIAPP